MEYEFLIDGREHTVSLEERDGFFRIEIEGRSFAADIKRVGENELSFLIGDRVHRVVVVRDDSVRHIQIRGQGYEVADPGEAGGDFADGGSSPDGGLKVRAPMPGKVIKIDVSAGDPVRINQTLAVIEAMKMENEIKSSIEGSVKAIFNAPGDLVTPEDVLIELIPDQQKPDPVD